MDHHIRLGWCLGGFFSALVGATAGVHAQCGVTFQSATHWTMGGTPRAVAVGDFNGDGRKDFATANFSTTNAVYRLANPTTMGSWLASVNVPLGNNQNAAAAIDLNHDGRDELLVLHSNATAGTSIGVIGFNANGTTIPTVLYPATNTQRFAIADVNHDGNLDLAYSCGTTCGVNIHTSNANGTLNSAVSYTTLTDGSTMTFADVNSDGALDIVKGYTPVTGNGRLVVALGTPPDSASFGAPTSYLATGLFGTFRLARGDFNGDGRDDVVTIHSISNGVQVFLSTAAGALVPQTVVPAGPTVQDVEAGDMNGDGALDAVVAANSTVTVYLGNGAGGLATGVAFNAAAGATDVELEDMNNDGKLDMVVANNTAGTVSVLLNTTPLTHFATQPNDVRTCPLGTAMFSAVGFTNLGTTFTYQWQYLNAGVWTNLAVGTAAGLGTVSFPSATSMTIANLQGAAGTEVAKVRCIGTTACGSITSRAAGITLIQRCGIADVGAVGGIYSPCGDGFLDNNDFVVFINLFFAGDAIADVGSQGGEIGPDGNHDNNDFVVYINSFFVGC